MARRLQYRRVGPLLTWGPHSESREKRTLVPISPFHLCSAQDATRGRMPLADSVGLSTSTNLEPSSQTRLEDCLCDDLKTHQGDEQD